LLRQLRLLLKLPPRPSFKHLLRQLFKHQLFRRLLRQSSKHQSSKRLLRPLLKLLLLPRSRQLRLDRLSRVEPHRVIQRVTSLVKRRVRLHRVRLHQDQTHRGPTPRARRLLEAHLVAPLLRRQVVRSAQLVAQFRRRLVAQ